MKKVLVVAVHPDDETLGCGGTLLRHKQQGDKIYWLIGTEIREVDGFEKGVVLARKSEINKVSQAYAFDGVCELGLPTAAVDTFSMGQLIAKISAVMNEIKPDTVYLPFRGDVHTDHCSLFDAAFACTKVFRYPFVKKVLMMEVPSETDFSPNVASSVFVPNFFTDITNHLNMKIEIMKLYAGEMAPHPFPRSVESLHALATLRGAQAGVRYAESFMLLKEIV